MAMTRDELRSLVEKEARTRGIDPALAWAIVRQESGGNPDVSARQEPRLGTASYGPMQVLGTTAKGMGFKGTMEELAQPETNVPLGMEYLRTRQIEGIKRGMAGQDLTDWMVAAYNAGTPRQTAGGAFANQAYVDSVMRMYGEEGGVPGYRPGGGPFGGLPEPMQKLMGMMAQLGSEPDMSGVEEYIQKVAGELPEDQAALTRESEGLTNIDQALSASLAKNPLAGPRIPLPEARSAGEQFISTLTSNLATGLTRNNLYAANEMQRQQQERLAGERVEQQNALLEREDMLNRRAELLQVQHDRYERARDYYEKKKDWVRSAEFAKEQLKIQTEMQKNQDLRQATLEWGKEYLEGQMALEAVLARAGVMMDQDGTLTRIPGAKIKGLADTSDKALSVEEAEKQLTELTKAWASVNKKTAAPGALQNLQHRYWHLLALPRVGDTFQTIGQRVNGAPGLPGWKGLMGMDDQRMDQVRKAIMHSIAMSHPELPGATEYMEEYERLLGLPKPKAAEGEVKGVEKPKAEKKGSAFSLETNPPGSPPSEEEKSERIREAMAPILEGLVKLMTTAPKVTTRK